MLISSWPIRTTEGKGAVYGSLIRGCYLNSEEIARLGQKTRLSLSVRRFGDLRLTPEMQRAKALLSKAMPILVRALGNNDLASVTSLPDIHDNPVLLLQVDMPRDI